jgi:hypothetical protein
MGTRHLDGSAGEANYGSIGTGYSKYRQPEPRIAEFINKGLGEAKRVINVGAGAGSYEPTDREVIAIEPSESMRSQRPTHFPKALDATAEKLPFPNSQFDASMATFTVHQWSDLGAGLKEMRRVTRGPVLILTCDPSKVQDFWLAAYAPDVLATEARRYPALATIKAFLGGVVEVVSVPIPLNCKDGFNEAYYGRPEKLLDEGARLACSAWSFVNKTVSAEYSNHLQRELLEGAWDSKYGILRTQPEFDGSLRLIIAHP